MLKKLTVRGFKSLKDVTVDFPRMAVLFGPNAAGKSNLLDAIQALSRIGTQRTLADALSKPIRGYPIEAFSFPPGGLADLLSSSSPHFSLEASLTREKDAYRYRVDVEIAPGSGALTVADEYLSALAKDGSPRGTAAIERIEGNLRVRRKNESGKPRYERLGQNYAILSDPRLGMPQYPLIEGARLDLSGWRTYYLDPRVAMRAAQPPSDVQDIAVLGGEIAPFLYRLRAEPYAKPSRPSREPCGRSFRASRNSRWTLTGAVARSTFSSGRAASITPRASSRRAPCGYLVSARSQSIRGAARSSRSRSPRTGFIRAASS